MRLVVLAVALALAAPAAAQRQDAAPPAAAAAGHFGMTHAAFVRTFNTSASSQQLPVRAVQRDCMTDRQMRICNYQFGRAVGMAGTAPALQALDTVMLTLNSDGLGEAVDAIGAFVTLMTIFEPGADADERGTVFRALMPTRGGRLQRGVAMLRATQFQVLESTPGNWVLVARRPG